MENLRDQHLNKFYDLLSVLEKNLGGARKLGECHGRMDWPQRGVYFFQELGETRSGTGNESRVVRVGTHAFKAGAKTKLWSRLSQHKGTVKSGGGDHRCSIFRLIVGASLMDRDGLDLPTWKQRRPVPSDVRKYEEPLEKAVSRVIGAMPFLWLPINDAAGPKSQRVYIKRNTIALLSNFGKAPLDPASPTWLGHNCCNERVCQSGLWNSNHVQDVYDPAFLDTLEVLIAQMRKEA